MKRRYFNLALGSAAASWPLAAGAQKGPNIARVGLLVFGSLDNAVVREGFDTIRQGLAQLGYLEGRNIAFEERGADGAYDRLPTMADELVGLKVDVIVALATPAGRAAQRATSSIPVVIAAMGDPVGDGLVVSLARPGANVTGTTFLGPELGPKRFSLLKELIPQMTRLAVLRDPGMFSGQTTTDMSQEIGSLAAGLGIQPQFIAARGPDEFERAFSEMAKGHADALFMMPSAMFLENRKRIVELAGTHRMPGIYSSSVFVELGGLISYGPDLLDVIRRTARLVDRILKGARPADLPVEQPTKFELAINRKTARTLGIDLPTTLLATAELLVD